MRGTIELSKAADRDNVRGLLRLPQLTLAALCVAATLTASASIQDKVLRFSSKGTDRYADGSPVADGECYALVWSPKGQAFAGFNADGTPVSSDDRVVLSGALARGGRCRDTLFQIPEREYAELADGEWAVCLIDTRAANGVPAGVDANGAPRRVNRWGVVESGARVNPSSASALAALRASIASAVDGARASARSAVPRTAPRPRIAAVGVRNGEVKLSVADTVPYLTYRVASGATPDALVDDPSLGVSDGAEGQLIEFKTGASAGSRFFKVTRAE